MAMVWDWRGCENMSLGQRGDTWVHSPGFKCRSYEEPMVFNCLGAGDGYIMLLLYLVLGTCFVVATSQ